MDSTLVIQNDEEDSHSLHKKYQQLATFSPKTKTQVNQSKNSKSYTQFQFYATPQQNTIPQVIQSLNILSNPFEELQHQKTSQDSKSLSPTKSKEETSEYTFKLYNGIKKVRFRE